MAILLDSGILFAYYDRRDRWHAAALRLLTEEAGGLIVPAAVVPEVDYLLGQRLGSAAQLVFYRAFVDGDLLAVDLPRDGFARVLELNQQYHDLRLGFVDASVIALAEHLGFGRIGTTDLRHFGVVKAKLSLELLPESPVS